MATDLRELLHDLGTGEVQLSELRPGDIVAVNVTDAEETLILAPVVVLAAEPRRHQPDGRYAGGSLTAKAYPHSAEVTWTGADAEQALAGRYLDQLEAWVRLCAAWRASVMARHCQLCASGQHTPDAL